MDLSNLKDKFGDIAENVKEKTGTVMGSAADGLDKLADKAHNAATKMTGRK